MQVLPTLRPQLLHAPRSPVLAVLLGRVHRLVLAVEELVQPVVGVDVDFGALGSVEDGLGKGGFGYRDRVAEAGSSLRRDAAFAVHVARVEGVGAG